MDKIKKLREYIKQNSKFLKLTTISKNINNNPLLLSNFAYKTYNGMDTELGEYEQKTLDFFERELSVTFNEDENAK